MVNLKWQYCILVVAAVFLSKLSYAQQDELVVDGEVGKLLILSVSDLQKMNTQDINWIDRDQQEKKYSGVPLADVLAMAGVPTGAKLRGENLNKFLLVSCADGYQVVFSLAELDPSFSDKKAILAFQEDGKALPLAKGPLQLIVSGEKKPARSCFQVVRLHIGSANVNE